MPPTVMTLRERFLQHPLLPPAVIEQQNRWRDRWGMQPKQPEPGEDWRYHIEVTRDSSNDPRERLPQIAEILARLHASASPA
jgi:hypothetical protein